MKDTHARKSNILAAERTPLWLCLFFAVLTAAYAFLLIRQPSPFFADDSFFYLQVGRNLALGHGSTFNGLMPTNGYHPLWMLLCAAVYSVFPDRIIGLHLIAGLIAALNILVLVVAARLLGRLRAPAWVAWTILVPFLFGLQLGTESSLSAAVLAGMLLALYNFLERPDWPTGIAFHLLAAVAVLSRLDSIFVVACLWIAILAWSLGERKQGDSRAVRIQLGLIPVYAILWGAYLASNLIWFHILMPISGLLKSHNANDHLLGQNLPHTAMLSFAICAISLLILWRKRGDRWFWFVELPFFAGIVIHAAYITLRMTSETRWTWYYVSWALLAALTASRVAACLFGLVAWQNTRRSRISIGTVLRAIGVVLAVLLSGLLWYRMGWKHSRQQMADNIRIPAMQQVLQKDGVQRVLAYDQPGGMAYFTPISVVPLDGLMADRAFQSELAQRGIADFIRKDQIDGFVGPPVPFDEWGLRTYCGQLFLESTKYTCEPWSPGPKGEPQWMITGVEVYSRLPLAPAGYISLPPSDIVWTGKNYVTVWRISASRPGGTNTKLPKAPCSEISGC